MKYMSDPRKVPVGGNLERTVSISSQGVFNHHVWLQDHPIEVAQLSYPHIQFDFDAFLFGRLQQ